VLGHYVTSVLAANFAWFGIHSANQSRFSLSFRGMTKPHRVLNNVTSNRL
jgi:hypothetical protein